MAKEQFHELSPDIIEYFQELEKKIYIPVDIKFVYQADNKQKTLVKIIKVTDRYCELLNAELLVSFNEDYFDAFDDESKNILIEQELALLEFDLDKGTMKIGKPDFVTSSEIVKKYGVDSVERANQIKKLYEQQQSDKDAEIKQAQKQNTNNTYKRK